MLFIRQFIPGALHAVLEVDSAEQHFESFGFQREFELAVGEGTWAAEAALFEPFRQNPNASPIPVEEFDVVAVAIEEDEYFAREWIFAQFVAHHDAEGVEALSQVAGTSGEADFDAVSEDHGCTGWAGWMRRMIPPPSSSSISGPAEARRLGAAPSSNSRNAGGSAVIGREAEARRRQFVNVW